MSILRKILKWIIGILMGIVLVCGLVDAYGIGFVEQTMPTSVEDLGWDNITLKQVTSAPSGIVFRAEGNPAIFVLTVIPPPANVDTIVKKGDKIGIRIKKEFVGQLQNENIVTVYGLQLENGQKMFDNTNLIPNLSASEVKSARKIFYIMIAVPALYFLAIFLGPIVWSMLKAQREAP